MSRSCNREQLETLVYGELDATESSAVEGHAAECDECEAELAWLRIERTAMDERAAQQPEMPAELWQGIEQRIAADAAGEPRKGLLYTLFPWRPGGDKARWFGFGLATAAATAAVLVVVMRSPEDGSGAQVAVVQDAGVEREAPQPDPVPAPKDRMAEAERALDEAEASHLAAMAALESAYDERRDSLDPAVAARYDAQLAKVHDAIAGARDAAGDDIDSRVRRLGAYSKQRRALQAMVYGLQEAE